MTKHLFSILVAAAGCAEPTEHLDETSQAVVAANGVSLNGVSLNGVSLNGVSLNGVSLNGVSLNGVSLNGVSLNGVSLNGVSLNGTSLTGVRDDSAESMAVPVEGVVLTATLSNGAELALRIDGVTDGAYAVSYASDDGWLPLCGDPEIGALAVPGTWSTEAGVPGGGAYSASDASFTFACRGKSIAKCVDMGYDAKGHLPQLESCVRLLRGDYCGDGTPYTVNGNQVNIYDDVGIQADTEHWTVEAEWTPAGARCIAAKRETRAYASGQLPPCVADRSLALPVCGVFRNGATLINEIPDPMLSPMATTTKLSTSSKRL